jgi:CheY-like chemotaxis protein
MKRILIVDDIEENLELLRIMLEGHGYKVEQAANGSEAITKALEKVPDMIISDILMPIMDGYTLCRKWKADERLKRVPFIFCTATYTDSRDEQLAINMGADAFIVKPVERDEFLRQVEAIFSSNKERMLASPQEPKAGDESILKNYNEVLIRKLEHKMLSLEQANKTLEAEIEARKQAEKETKRLNSELEQRVAQRTAELLAKNTDLERINKVFVDRELRMRELKARITELEKKA